MALSTADIARHCMASESTVTRWRASGKLRPAQSDAATHGRVTYFFVADLQRLRAEALAEIKTKVGTAQLTAEERAAVLVAGLEELAVGLDKIAAMFAQLGAAKK